MRRLRDSSMVFFFKSCLAFIYSAYLVVGLLGKELSFQAKFILGCSRSSKRFVDVEEISKLRDIAYGFLRFEVKDGKSTYF